MFTRVFLALALLGCLAAATDPSLNNLRKKKGGKGKKGKSDAELYADIEIKGLKKDPSPNELAMIDDAIKLALNDGLKDSDYDMTDVVDEKIWVEPDAYVLLDSQAGNDSSLTGPYKLGVSGSYGNFFISAMLRYTCNLCVEDADTSAALRQFELTGPPKVSSADEKEVCELLRNTGVKNFANVHDCSIKIVHKKAASAFDLAVAAE
jgi:hypothetical protein